MPESYPWSCIGIEVNMDFAVRMKEGPMGERNTRAGGGRLGWCGHWPACAIAVVVVAATMMLVAGGGCSSGPTETQEDSYSVGDSPKVVVTTENGFIQVNSGPAGEVQVEATIRGSDRIDYEVSQEGDTVTVEARVDSSWFVWGDSGADIEVTAPASTEVRLETSNGAVRVYGTEGSGFVRTSNGKIDLRDVKGDFDVRTSNGEIEIDSLEGTALVRTSNGRLDLEGMSGEVDAETSNGAIWFGGNLTAGSDYRLVTSNGDVSVVLESPASVSLDARTSNGEVRSEVPVSATLIEEDHLVGTIGDGEAELYMRTSNGDVTIR
jgi:DUF4097 and DUF4098 domain-containing protein YvlB